MGDRAPRCGRPMLRYEAVHGALLDDPLCGLRLDHAGQCRSELSLKRERERDRDRAQQARHRRDLRLAAAELAALPPLGRRICEARQQAGMSQQALAAAVGVSQSSISHWELDRFDPGAGMLARVAAATGAPAGWLTGQGGGLARAA